MDITDEIEVSTILEMQLSHSDFNPFYNISLSMTAKKPAKHCAARSEFLFVYFLVFVVVVVALSFVVALQT